MNLCAFRGAIAFAILLNFCTPKSGWSISEVDSLEHLVANSTDPYELASNNLELSYWFMDSLFDRTLTYAERSAQFAMQINNDSILHAALDMSRYMHYLMGNYQNMLHQSLQALRVSKRMGKNNLIADDHGWLMMCHINMENLPKALTEARAGLAASQKSGDTLSSCRAHTDMVNALRENGMYEEALEYGEKAVRMYEAMEYWEEVAFTKTEIAETHFEKSDFTSALRYALQAKNILDTTRCTNITRLWNRTTLTKAYMALGHLSQAQSELLYADSIAHQLKANKEIIDLLELSSQLAAESGEHEKALELFKEFKKAHDALEAENNSQRMLSIQAAFDLEASEIETRRLTELNKLNESHLSKQKRLNSYLWISAIILLLTIVGVLYSVWKTRNMRQSIRMSQQQIEEQRRNLEEKRLEIEHQQVRLNAALMSDANYAKQIEEATRTFEATVKLQYATVREHIDSILPDDMDGKEELSERIRNIENTVLNLFNGSPQYRTALEDMVRRVVDVKVSERQVRTLPMINIISSVSSITDKTRFLIGLVIGELITISYGTLLERRKVQFIKITLEQTGVDTLRFQYSTNEDPFEFTGHSEHVEIARKVLYSLVKELEGEASVSHGEETTFQMLLRTEPDTNWNYMAS